MRLLLDTHVAIWWALGNTQLSLAGRALIENDRNEAWVSIVSLWEIAIKNAVRRANGIGVSAAAAAQLMEEASFGRLALDLRHVAAVETLPLLHRDPFDRMLVAQATVDGFRLVTHDRMLADYGEHVLLV